MKPPVTVLLCVVLFTGCAGTTRLVTNTAAAGAGAAIGNKLGHGNLLTTAAGAGAGLLIGEGLNYASNNAAERAQLEGYNKGRSDAVKQQYWIMANQQRTAAEGGSEENISLFDIPIPEQQIDGVNLKATTRTLRIQE